MNSMSFAVRFPQQHVLQWGGSHVWKVGGKVFAIGAEQDNEPAYTFKVTGIAYELLKEQSGLRPAPYLASRGIANGDEARMAELSDAIHKLGLDRMVELGRIVRKEKRMHEET